jgi:hypothetical protein
MASDAEEKAGCTGAMCGFLIGAAIIGVPVGLYADHLVRVNITLKAEAIEKGYAEYNPKTGEWQWKEKP